MPHPEISVVDGATSLFAEVGVSSGMVQVEFVSAEEVELIDGEAEFPGDVSPMEGRGFNFLWGFSSFLSVGVRHGIIFKCQRR